MIAVLRNGGGYAEEIMLDAATVVPIPETMDFVIAAAFPVAYGTSYFALTHRGHLQSGETLLVLGAAGGVGLTAVEIGKALGARVIAAAGGADKLAVAKSRGADELIDYRSESIRDRVRELTGGKGADVYRPDAPGRFPVLLSRLPYDKNLRPRPGDIDYFVERGYGVIMQDTRGRFASEGEEYYALIWEMSDGYDAVE